MVFRGGTTMVFGIGMSGEGGGGAAGLDVLDDVDDVAWDGGPRDHGCYAGRGCEAGGDDLGGHATSSQR